jgi:hypothetical protein
VSVVDLDHFDADLDSAYHPDADPEESGFLFDANPDSK